MKIIAIVFALIVVTALSGLLYLKHRMLNTTDRKNLEADIDAEVSKFVKLGQATGLLVGVYKDGKPFVKGYGTTGNDVNSIPGAATIFQIGSISKLFTASLLQILCDEGVVRMDATLGELIGRSKPLSQAAQQVTLRQLVTHTSGFPSIPKSLGLKASKASKMAGDVDPLLDPFSYLGPQFVFEYLATAEDKRKPGRFEYSNFGMGLLGHVLEVVTEKDFESLVVEKILAPLGMKATGITLTPELKEHLAQGYTPKGAPTRIWTFAALAGAGAFYSNAQDMLKFVRANVDDGGPTSESLRKMHEPQFGGDTGIGWIQPTFLDKFFGNGNIVWHNGMVYGYASYLSIDAQTRTGIVILTNKAIGPEMLGTILTRLVRTQSWSLHTSSLKKHHLGD